MIFPPELRQDAESSFKRFHLTEQQFKTAKLLSPETCAYFEHMATDFLEQIAGIEFAGTAEEQEVQHRQHAGLVERRKLLLELLAEAAGEWENLAVVARATMQNGSGQQQPLYPEQTVPLGSHHQSNF